MRVFNLNRPISSSLITLDDGALSELRRGGRRDDREGLTHRGHRRRGRSPLHPHPLPLGEAATPAQEERGERQGERDEGRGQHDVEVRQVEHGPRVGLVAGVGAIQ